MRFAAFAIALAAPATAGAALAPLPVPGGGQVDGFAVHGGTWLAVTSKPATSGSDNMVARLAWVSTDHGQTWTHMPMSSPEGPDGSYTSVYGATVGPDGAFYLAAGIPNSGPRILRYAPGMSIFETVVSAPAAQATSPPAWDGAGQMWVAQIGKPSSSLAPEPLTLTRVSGPGAPETHQITTFSQPSGAPHLLFDGTDAIVATSRGHWTMPSDGTVRAGAVGPQVARYGDAVLYRYALSYDAGAHTVELGNGFENINGQPGLISFQGRALAATAHGQRLVEPPSLVAPGGATRVLGDDGQLIAVDDISYTALPADHWSSSATFPPVFAAGPAAITWDWPVDDGLGALSDYGEQMRQATNAARRQVDVPPLVADGRIGAAAVNHSNYWALNPTMTHGAHDEQPGQPGFTGVDPPARCIATGAQCGGEVVGGGQTGTEAAMGLLATVYHREAMLEASYRLAGAGHVAGGPAVMDFGPQQDSGLALAPAGFPVGDWAGPVKMWGETPNPRAACADHGQQVPFPSGVPITVTIPGERSTKQVLSMSLREHGDSNPLAGCWVPEDPWFMPNEPLKPSTTYDAEATYIWMAGAAPQTYHWSFRTAANPIDPYDAGGGSAGTDGPGAGSGTTPASRERVWLATRRVRIGRALKLRYRAGKRGTLSITLSPPHRHAQHKAFKTRAGTHTVTISTRGLRAGKVTVKALLKGRSRTSFKGTLTLLRAKNA